MILRILMCGFVPSDPIMHLLSSSFFIPSGVNVVEMLSPGQAWDFPSLQAAARYCEHQFLDLAVSRGLIEPARTLVTLEEVLEAHASQVS